MSDNKKQMMAMISFQGRRTIRSTTMTVAAPDLTFRCRKAENLDQ